MKKGLKQAKIDQLQLSFLAKICVLEKKSLNKKSVELHFPQKLAFSGKRGRFRAKSYEIKVVGNAILQNFYSVTFFLGRIF